MGENRFYAEQRGTSYKEYYGSKSFIIPEEQAKENRFVYFAKLSSYYHSSDSGNEISKEIKQDVYNRLNQILEAAKQIQLKREASFVKQMQSANSKEFGDFEFGDYKNALTLSTNTDLLNKYREYFSQAIMAEGIKENVYASLNHEDFYLAMQTTLDEMLIKHGKDFFKNIEKNSEITFTNEFKTKLWINLRNNLLKDIKGVNSLPIDKNILEAFGGLGKIKNASKSKITQYLKGEGIKNIYDPKDLNLRGLHNNITGIKDELSSFFALQLKKAFPESKVTYESKYTGGEFTKTDLTQIVHIPDEKDIISRKINISAKATNIVQKNYRTEAKFAEKSSLTLRYGEISKYTGISQESFSELFYNINNQIANGITIKDKSILEILALASINFMFGPTVGNITKEMKNGNGEINLFLIGGQLIPSSMIFSFMQIKVKELVEAPNKIARVSFGKPPQTIGEYYYTATNYYKEASVYAEDNTSHRTLPWQHMRKWLEDKATMGFYLNTAKIFDMLKIENGII